jgi:hypothetical protein
MIVMTWCLDIVATKESDALLFNSLTICESLSQLPFLYKVGIHGESKLLI